MSRYYDDSLMHYQRKGAHWGQRNGPPYPLNSAGLAKFRKKVKEFKDGAEDRKARKAIKKAVKTEEKLAKRQEKHEKNLEALSKSPTALYKNRDAFTTEELNRALNRINTEQRLHEASLKELRRGKDIADTIIGYGKTVNDAYNTINNMKNNYESFKNGAFGKKQVKQDDGNDGDKKEDSDRALPGQADASLAKAVDFTAKSGVKAGASKAKEGAKAGADKLKEHYKQRQEAKKPKAMSPEDLAKLNRQASERERKRRQQAQADWWASRR